MKIGPAKAPQPKPIRKAAALTLKLLNIIFTSVLHLAVILGAVPMVASPLSIGIPFSDCLSNGVAG
tara:strand:- start:182 stop:379 length:198 start_codon:yes stop_codon:yes gene_type:complete